VRFHLEDEMKFFGLMTIEQESSTQQESVPADQWGGQTPEEATPQMLGMEKLFGRDRRVVTFVNELDAKALAAQYQARVDEVLDIIKSRQADPEGKIKVDKVLVKLGVDAGGSIGWFVEGRLDVAFAFEIEFKVSE
jgi:hypothetical protein